MDRGTHLSIFCCIRLRHTADSPDSSGFLYTILLDLMMLSSLTAIGVTLMTLYHSESALEK